MPDSDVLGYAFSAAGSLDPGTKLLDVGLHEHTPLQARAELLDDPLHMSVAIHELTHFVSLENSLGHVIAFLAMRTKDLARSIQTQAEKGDVDAGWVLLYARRHREYQLMLELWRPLLEGLAVYAQLHEPDENEDALIEPMNLLLSFSFFISLMGVDPQSAAEQLQSGDDDFHDALFDAVRAGPKLLHGTEPLSVGFEFIDPSGLRPYFLGHAYIRALQVALVEKSPFYSSSAKFFQLVVRILRSSTRGTLADAGSWGQSKLATRVYGWVDTVRAASAARVEALREQADAVDVLHFLSTGDVRIGYDSEARGASDTVKQLAPQLWNEFEQALAQRDLSGGGAPADRAARLVAAWIAGTMALNLSSNGVVYAAGWIPAGLAPLHALALNVDDAVWWLALADADLGTLGIDTSGLRVLDPKLLLGQAHIEPTSLRLTIDSSIAYTPESADDSDPTHRVMMPKLSFRLWNPATPDAALDLTIAPAIRNVSAMHLRLLNDRERELLQFSASPRLRYELRDAPTPDMIVELLEARGQKPLADALRVQIEDEDLAISRVVSDVDRRILAALLEREPIDDDLDLLERGIGVLPNARKFGPIIAASYSTFVWADAEMAASVSALNDVAEQKLGKPVFAMDDKGFVRYRGLWGEPS